MCYQIGNKPFTKKNKRKKDDPDLPDTNKSLGGKRTSLSYDVGSLSRTSWLIPTPCTIHDILVIYLDTSFTGYSTCIQTYITTDKFKSRLEDPSAANHSTRHSFTIFSDGQTDFLFQVTGKRKRPVQCQSLSDRGNADEVAMDINLYDLRSSESSLSSVSFLLSFLSRSLFLSSIILLSGLSPSRCCRKALRR